jgi:hypothetical protein
LIVGGQDAVLQREHRDRGLEPAGGPEQVAVHRLGGGHRELVGVAAEHRADRLGLDRVGHGRGAVGVDVADLLGAMPASRMAIFMQRWAPSPPGGGMVMW